MGAMILLVARQSLCEYFGFVGRGLALDLRVKAALAIAATLFGGAREGSRMLETQAAESMQVASAATLSCLSQVYLSFELLGLLYS